MKYAKLLVLALACAACSSGQTGDETDAGYERQVVQGVHATLLSDIHKLHSAAVELQQAAPAAEGRGWDSEADVAAIDAMTAAWLRARGAYERTEGALAPLFPDLDAAVDARYDDFLQSLGPAGDADLFDDQGVTGMHALERILFAPTTPSSVITLEATLPGYVAAAWPSTEQQALAFKGQLCARLVSDTAELEEEWRPQRIDLDASFRGLIALMNEQREKVIKAASEEEESRYAGRTLADLRDNLAGTAKVYGVFRAWLATHDPRHVIDDDIEAAFQRLDTAYSRVDGDAIPQPQKGFSAEQPSATDLATPFGELYETVQESVDPNRAGSAVDGMHRAASALGFPELASE